MIKEALAPQVAQPEHDEALISERTESYHTIISDNLAQGFTQMPDLVRETAILSRSAKLVYEQLLRYTRQKACCWPSQERIAKDLGTISCRTVIRAIKELYQRGFITRRRRGLKLTNVYYINPLTFLESPKAPSRDQDVPLDSPGAEIRASEDDIPQPEFTSDLSLKCQSVTSRNDTLALQEMTLWHTKHTKSNHIKTETNESKIRCGANRAEPEKGRDLSNHDQSCSHIARTTIGKETEIYELKNTDQQNKVVEQIEISNQSNNKETGHPQRAKDVKDDKKSKNSRTFEDMATLIGIAPEALEDMLTWLKQCTRPEATPLKIQGVVSQWSRELGNAEPQLIAANITQSSKLYRYARLNGLSQQAIEDCFEHAREAVRNHPEVKKKMAFFFTSLKLDILIALKECQDLSSTSLPIPSSIPDGYEEDMPVNEPLMNEPPSAEAEAVGMVASSASVPESEPVLLVVEPITLPPDYPRPEWRTWKTADWWGEHLRDELDPARQFSWYEVCPTESDCYGFVFFLNEQADPIWRELLAGSYVTNATVKQALETIRTVRGPQYRERGRK